MKGNKKSAKLIGLDGRSNYIGPGTARKLELAGRAKRISSNPLRLRLLGDDEYEQVRLRRCRELARWSAISDRVFRMNGCAIGRMIGGGIGS